MKYSNMLIGLLVVGVIVSGINLIFVEMPRNYNLGFQHGYLCAYHHEDAKDNLTIHNFEKSEYCEKFSSAFDKELEKFSERIA